MKITINLEIDPENQKDMMVFNNLTESIRALYDANASLPLKPQYEEAWQQCSWEIITLAITVLKICDGASDKGIYAIFESLLNPELTALCGTLNDRAISSRVGRTAVICKKMGNFRLMEVAVRRKDQTKRVYILPEAKDALLKLLSGEWGKEFNNYLVENELDIPDLSDL